jgi:hypothetical protein
MHDIPGGRVELRDPDEVLELHARRIRALRMAMAQNADVLAGVKEVQAKEAAGVELTDEDEMAAVQAMAPAMPIIQELEDATIAARLKSWSFDDEDGNPLPPKVESLVFIPAKAWQALKELCASTVSEIEVDTEISPDPKAITPLSTV